MLMESHSMKAASSSIQQLDYEGKSVMQQNLNEELGYWLKLGFDQYAKDVEQLMSQ